MSIREHKENSFPYDKTLKCFFLSIEKLLYIDILDHTPQSRLKTKKTDNKIEWDTDLINCGSHSMTQLQNEEVNS